MKILISLFSIFILCSNISMKNSYFKYLSDNNIIDILSEINELSYSKKLEIVKNLNKEFKSSITNLTLIEYKRSYININRINLLIINNTLKGIAKRFKLIEEINEQYPKIK